MSPKEDEAARKARAKRLRDQIDAVTGKVAPEEESPETKESKAVSTTPESPREFTQRRMRELKEEDKKKSAP